MGKATEHLPNPEPPKVIGTCENMPVEQARRYHTATASVGFGAGRHFVKRVDLSGRKKLTDLGGGSGAYSNVAAQTFPPLRAVVFDLQPVVVVTQEFIERNGVADRVTTQGGNFTRNAFPTGCDVAIMAGPLRKRWPTAPASRIRGVTA